jgi:hypothetical protein
MDEPIILPQISASLLSSGIIRSVRIVASDQPGAFTAQNMEEAPMSKGTAMKKEQKKPKKKR